MEAKNNKQKKQLPDVTEVAERAGRSAGASHGRPEDENEWAEAIARAKHPLPAPDRAAPARPAFDLRAWEENIDRAIRPARSATERSDQTHTSLAERLERLARRVESRKEEEMWRAAIRHAKTGNS